MGATGTKTATPGRLASKRVEVILFDFGHKGSAGASHAAGGAGATKFERG